MRAWRDVPKLPLLRPAEGEAQRHNGSLGDLVLDDGPQIRERVAQLGNPRRDPQSPWCVGFWRFVAAVSAKKLVRDGQVALGQQLINQAPSVRLQRIHRHGASSPLLIQAELAPPDFPACGLAA